MMNQMQGSVMNGVGGMQVAQVTYKFINLILYIDICTVKHDVIYG